MLHDVDLAVDSGENSCLLVGPNGVGKTTLFRTTSLGSIRPQGGQVLVDPGAHPQPQPGRGGRADGLHVPANTAPFPFHVRDVVLTGRPHPPLRRPAPRPRYRGAGPGAHGHRRPGRSTLHRDQRRRAPVGADRARASPGEPRVLIMDEPSSHLDFGTGRKLLGLIKALVEERDLAVLMSSHFPNHAFACASRVALVKDGRLLAEGPPQQVLTEANLRASTASR